MKRLLLIAFILLCSGSALQAQWNIPYSLAPRSVSNRELEQHFRTPQPESRLHVFWWWLNGIATKESITRDLEEMKVKGYGGAIIFDAGSSDYSQEYKNICGPRFMSPEWMELYSHAVREADRLGLELSINLQSGWNPGAPCVTPEHAAKKLTYSETEVDGGCFVEVRLPVPPSKLLYEDILVQAYPVRKSADDKTGIKDFSKKAFYDRMGWKGTYPLHILEEDYPERADDAVIDPAELIDLTGKVDSCGVLRWNAPAGRWNVIRYGMTCTGIQVSTSSLNWTGLSYDHMSRDAFRLFADSIIVPLIAQAHRAGKSLRYLHTDSWEMGVVNWTPYFREEFKSLRGYDMTPWLPVMTGKIVQSRELSNRFLRDMRRTVADLVYRNHYKLMSDLAYAHGVGIHPESGGPHSAPVDGLEIMGLSDIPTGEFWATANTHRILDDERLAVKQAASAAHTNSRRFAQAEGPTSIGPHWERAPRDLKSNLDRVFCSGINRILWHTYTSSPKEHGLPGVEYFAGTHFNANTTWWPYSQSFVDYLNRTTQMLSEGLFVADVLYYYGDNVPNYAFVKEDKELADLPFGYDYDKVSKNILLERAFVKEGRLTLPDGMSYRVLMLPHSVYLDVSLLLKIEDWIREGLIVLGNPPQLNSTLDRHAAQDSLLQTVVARMWKQGNATAEYRIGKGRLFAGMTIAEVLDRCGIVPDFGFESASPATRIDFIHRATEDADIYFIANPFAFDSINDYKFRYITDLPDRYESVECRFRVTGARPEIWDPMTGEIRTVTNFREEKGYTTLPLTLDPEGSLLVVFRRNEKPAPQVFFGNNIESFANIVTERPLAYGRNGRLVVETSEAGQGKIVYPSGNERVVSIDRNAETMELDGAWMVTFDPVWGGPEAPMEMRELKAWNEFEEPGIRYYSGTAVYRLDFRLSKSQIVRSGVYLDLGNVLEMARVRINGKEVGVCWKPPYLLDVTEFVRPGNNNLEVEVVNMWVNRLIGDARQPREKRYTHTNITKFDHADDSLLRRSGLLGPVRIVSRPRLDMEIE